MSRNDTPRVFRVPPLAALAAITLTVCVTPVAISAVWLLWLYLVPIAVVVWIARVRTVVDTESVVVRGVLRTRRVTWADITALRLRSSRTRSRVSAVLASGSELPLPTVHARDLPVIAAASGGRIPDPSQPPAEPETEPAEPATSDAAPKPAEE